jgi:DNA-binding response OmpR family regulator
VNKQKKILVVDDEVQLKQAISIRLEVNDFDVIGSGDGEDGLEKAKNEKPDLIILDLMLPKLNGFEVCRMLKFDDTYKNIPIIILSALDQQGDREKAIQCGADAYFIKPFDFDLLVTKIRSLLK